MKVMKKERLIALGVALIAVASFPWVYKTVEKEKDRQRLIEVRHTLSLGSLTGAEYAEKTEDLKKDFKYLNSEDNLKERAIDKGVQEVYSKIIASDSSIESSSIKSDLSDYINYRVWASSLDWKDTEAVYFKNIDCIARLATEEYKDSIKGTVVREIEVPFPNFIDNSENKLSVILFFIEKTGTANG